MLSDAYLRAKRRKLRSGTVSTCLLSPRQTTKFPKKQVRGRLRRAATIADAVTVTKKTLLRSLVYSFVDFCQSPPYLNMSVEVSGRLAYRRVVHGCGVVGLLLDFAHARVSIRSRIGLARTRELEKKRIRKLRDSVPHRGSRPFFRRMSDSGCAPTAHRCTTRRTQMLEMLHTLSRCADDAAFNRLG